MGWSSFWTLLWLWTGIGRRFGRISGLSRLQSSPTWRSQGLFVFLLLDFFFALAVLLYVWFMILRWEEPVGVETDLSSLIQCPSWRAQNETLDVMGRYRFNSPILLCLSLHNGRRWELFSFLSRITKGPWFCVSSIVFYWSYSPFSLWAPIRKNMLFSFFRALLFFPHFISIHRLSIGV